MSKINIGGTEYPMKFSLGFWEYIENKIGINHANFDKKLNESPAKNSAHVILAGIYFAIPKGQRPEKVDDLELSVDQIKDELDMSCFDAIEETYIEGLPRAQREAAKKLLAAQDREIDGLLDDSVKKK